MSVPNKSAQRAFLKGLQLIYKKLFQYSVIWFLDEDTETDSVYDETPKKVYHNGIQVLSHYVRERDKDSDPIKETDEKIVFKVPIQEFIDNEIPFSANEDLEVLRKCIIEFNGEYYRVEEVNPYSVVAGQYLMCQFRCLREEDELEFKTEEVEETEGDETDV